MSAAADAAAAEPPPVVLAPYAVAEPDAAPGLLASPRQTRFLDWTLDVLISVVVINLFVEYLPSVIIESFTLSILTAVLLKVVLDVIVRLKKRTLGWFQGRGGAWRLGGYVALWAILFTSKFVVLELTNLVFRKEVQLGGFIEVTILILALMLAREAVALVYHRLLAVPTAATGAG